MKNIWDKIKGFLSWAWNGLTLAGRIIFGLIIVGVIAVAAFASTKDSDNTDKENSDPEVAQVYEPSIGTPLPADTPGETSAPNGAVNGALTTEPHFVAPSAGVDDEAPIQYDNTSLKFSAVLPPHSQINEQPNEVTFSTATGRLMYVVSTQPAGTENLASIESQLRNSPTASNIARGTFNTFETITFTAKGYGTGTVFITNGNIYYLLGDKQYFADFKTL